MILDDLRQWHRYAALGSRFDKAFRYLETITASNPAGRCDIDGRNLYAMVQAYPSRPVEQCRFEVHRQYADIQFIVAGRERILWSPLAALTVVSQPYDAEKDVAFFGTPDGFTPLHLAPGQFAVFWPEDGHAPGAEWGGIADVRKVVVKVHV